MQEATAGETAIDTAAVWGMPLVAVHCPHCRKAHLVPEEDVPERCPFCLQGPVAPQPVYLREPPEQVLPYEVAGQRLAGALERWAKGVWFRPGDLKGDTLARRALRCLIPLWLVDGRVRAAWRADVGFDYQVVSYQDQYRDGAGWNSREVQETRVRWEPRVGRLDRRYENLATPALDDHRQLAARLGEFNLAPRTAYNPQTTAAVLANAAVQIPSLSPQAAWSGAESAFVRAAQAECEQAAGADHIRDFTLEAEYGDLNWTLLLLPAYVTWYEEGGKTWPVLVNGQSGRVSGVKRASLRKATITSLVLGVIGLLLFIVGGLLSLPALVGLVPMAFLGGVILLIGALLVIAAPIAVISAWVSNRRSASDLP